MLDKIVACLFLGMITNVSAAEVRVLTGNAVSGPQQVLAKEFSLKTGHDVKITSANPAVIQQKMKAREPFDLYVIPSQFLRTAEKDGALLDGTLRPVAKVGVGIAARGDGPKLEFSTPDTFRKLLLGAKVITFSDATTGGLSGLSVLRVLDNLGVTEAVKQKADTRGNGQELVGSGEADFGLYNVSEIPRAANVVLAGRVPYEVQAWLEYDGAVTAMNAASQSAADFLEFISNAHSKHAWEAAGIDLAR